MKPSEKQIMIKIHNCFTNTFVKYRYTIGAFTVNFFKDCCEVFLR